MGVLLNMKLMINYDELGLPMATLCLLLSNWCWSMGILFDPFPFQNFPKSWILLMNWLEVLNTLVVRLVLPMLFHSWTSYCHELLGLNLLLGRIHGWTLSLTLAMNCTCRWLGLLELIMLLFNSLCYDDNGWIIR